MMHRPPPLMHAHLTSLVVGAHDLRHGASFRCDSREADAQVEACGHNFVDGDLQ